MRKKMVAGNWKMCGLREEAYALTQAILAGASTFSEVDIVLFPSFVHLQTVESLLKTSAIAWGAQNLYPGTSGAFTGEISGNMLKEYGCTSVLIGHSERRHIMKEDLKLISAKFNAACAAGLMPVLCVGETQAEREQGLTEAVIKQQLTSVMENAKKDDLHHAVIAYEPVWAIGTGLTATPEQAQAVHVLIRETIATLDADLAKKMRILYGGSVKPDNAKGLFAMPDIDGGLIGGASLNATHFLQICAS